LTILKDLHKYRRCQIERCSESARNWNYFDSKDSIASWQLVFHERIVPMVGLKWGTRVARFSSGISPTIGVVKLKDAPNQHRSIASFLFW